MPNGDESVEQALGSVCLSANTIPRHDSQKLDYGADAAPRSAAAPPPSPPGGAGAADAGATDPTGAADAGIADADAARAGGGAGRGSARGEARAFVDQLAHGLSELAQTIGQRTSTPPRPDTPVKITSEEGLYLLATYCFDLERKMEYIYTALEKYALKGDPAIARQLLQDERTINRAGLTWKQRAMLAESRLRELQKSIGPRHLKQLEQVAGGGTAAGGGPTPPR